MDRIKRIQSMEQRFDRVTRVLDDFASLQNPQELFSDIKTLEEYYTSSLWLEDYDEDCKGNLPINLKRGVLSQDGIDHLLDRYKELLKIEHDE